METSETRAKLAGAIRDLQSKGKTDAIPSLVSAYKAKYSTPAPAAPVTPPTTFPLGLGKIDKAKKSTVAPTFNQSVKPGIAAITPNVVQDVADIPAANKVSKENMASDNAANDTIQQYKDQIKYLQSTGNTDDDTAERIVQLHQKIGDAAKAAVSSHQNYRPTTQRSLNLTPGEIAGDALGAGLNAGFALEGGAAIADFAKGGALTAEEIAAEQAKKALPRGKKIANAAINVAKGVAKSAPQGYAFDVVNNLSEGKTGGNIAKPGAGTIVSAALPIAGEALSHAADAIAEIPAKKAAQREALIDQGIAGTKKEIEKFGKFGTVKKLLENARSKGEDPAQLLAQSGVLKGAVDDNGLLSTIGEGGAREKYYEEHVKPTEGVVRKNLEIEGNKVPIADIEKALNRAVNSSNLEGEALVNAQGKVKREIQGLALRADADGNVPLTKVHDAKVNKYETIDYLNPSSKKADKAIANAYKTVVEDNTKSINTKNINKELGRHLNVLKLIERLDNKRVEGGRLGKYVARGIGAVIGSKGGPIGSILGSELGGRIQGAIMARTFSSNASRIIEKSPEMIQALENIEKAADEATKEQYMQKLRGMLAAKNVKPAEVPSLYEAYIPEDKQPVIQMGTAPKPKADTSTPVIDQEAPLNVSSPELVKPVVKKKTSLYEPYIAPEDMKVIDYGKPAPKKKSGLPTTAKNSLPNVAPDLKPEIKVYRGEKGKGVSEIDFNPKRVLTIENDQQELIRKLAKNGNKDAEDLVKKYGNSKIDYNLADKVIVDAYKNSYDSIRYENKNMPRKGFEFHDLSNGKFYSEKREIAEAYSLQNRAAKYEKKQAKIPPKKVASSDSKIFEKPKESARIPKKK